jgi:hypothetical protein
MAKNPREPKAVKKLIADAESRKDAKKAKKPPISAHVHTVSSVWNRIRLRRNGGNQ